MTLYASRNVERFAPPANRIEHLKKTWPMLKAIVCPLRPSVRGRNLSYGTEAATKKICHLSGSDLLFHFSVMVLLIRPQLCVAIFLSVGKLFKRK